MSVSILGRKSGVWEACKSNKRVAVIVIAIL
jgi:hypothetical protein